MKKTIFLLLFPIITKGQFYIGNSMGLSRETYSYIEEDEEENYNLDNMFYSMIGGQQIGLWMIETGWSYNGILNIPLLIGRRIPIVKNTSIEILVGGVDEMAMDGMFNAKNIKSLSLHNELMLTEQTRVVWKMVYIHFNIYKGGYSGGIGLKGFMNR